jgi:tetratricopeptide (TPR) repeat protein
MLAMKLVRGRPWNRMIEEDFARMTPADFLGRHLPILIDVAQATAFAHSRGIVHRDLKPQQVMVGEFGEVVLMDWGLAVRMSDAPESRRLREARFAADLDHASSPSGTPAFMAPEQTASSAIGVGAWTDIYLLGGTLYLLLCGKPPHDAQNSRMAFLRAAEGVVRPLAEVAPGRDIPADLAQLAMRALAKEPTHRLGTAMEFAQGLQDHLSGVGKRREAEALLAGARQRLDAASPDYQELAEVLSALDRAEGLWPGLPAVAELKHRGLERFARRAIAEGDLALARQQASRMPEGATRGALLAEVADRVGDLERIARQRRLFRAAAAMLALAMAVGTFVYSSKLREQRDAAEAARVTAENAQREEAAARQAAEESRREEAAARRAAEAARLREEAARSRAELARGRSERLIDFMIGDLLKQLEPVGKLELLSGATTEAIRYFSDLPADEVTSATLRQQLDGLNAAVAAGIRLGRFEEVRPAIGVMERVFPQYEQLAPPGPEVEIRRALTISLGGELALRERRFADAIDPLRRAQRIFEDVVASEYAPPEALDRLAASSHSFAQALTFVERRDEATSVTERAISVLEGALADDRGTSATLRSLGALHFSRGDADIIFGRLEGMDHYRKARMVLRQVLEKDPLDHTASGLLSSVLGRLAVVELQLYGNPGEASVYAQEALAIDEASIARNPTSTELRRNLQISHSLVGLILLEQGNPAAAVPNIRRALAEARLLRQLSPGVRTHVVDMISNSNWLGRALFQSGDLDGAIDTFLQTVPLLRESAIPREGVAHIGQFDTKQTGYDAAQGMQTLADACIARRRFDDAREALDVLVAITDVQRAAFTDEHNHQEIYLWAQKRRAMVAMLEGDLAEMRLATDAYLDRLGSLPDAVTFRDAWPGQAVPTLPVRGREVAWDAFARTVSAAELCARLAEASGSLDEARAAWAEVLARFEEARTAPNFHALIADPDPTFPYLRGLHLEALVRAGRIEEAWRIADEEYPPTNSLQPWMQDFLVRHWMPVVDQIAAADLAMAERTARQPAP